MTVIRCLLLSLVLLTSTASLASAQNKYCDGSQFDSLTNMWKLEPDQNTRQVTAGELAAERTVMRRVVEMFKSAFVPTGAAGYYGANYDVLPQALNKDRYGNTYIFALSNHKIECRRRQAGRAGRLARQRLGSGQHAFRRRGREGRLLRRLQLPAARVLPAQGQDCAA